MAYTPEELWVEYYEDCYAKKPAEMALFDIEDDGLAEDVVFETGDPVIDEIERRLAAGEDPEEVVKLLDRPKDAVVAAAEEAAAAAEEFSDDYTSEGAQPQDGGPSSSSK